MKIKFFFTILSFVAVINVNSARASFSSSLSDIEDSFLLKPAATLEYQLPHIASNGGNSQFKNETIWNQIKNLNNIAIGAHFRVHKYLGFNMNWSKFTMESSNLNGVGVLSNKANLAIQNINFSSLWYAPLIGDHLLEGFIEMGLSDVQSQFKYASDINGFVNIKDHATVPLYGVGLQFSPYNSETVFRISIQKYNTKLSPLNADIVSWRAGVVQYF